MTGDAFASGPATGEELRRLAIENSAAETVAISQIDGDAPTGTLTSPVFKIARRYISFRIGGGNYERHACIDLLVDGKIVKAPPAETATGWALHLGTSLRSWGKAR